jgi:hypothetical protein
MIEAVIALSLLQGAPVTSGTPLDVSALKVGSPTTVAELDLGKLKGDLRQIGWSADGAQLYIQTAEGTPPSRKLRHYTVAASGGTVASVDRQPVWATEYWTFKSDRSAPGVAALIIDLEQKFETITAGTGQAGALDREAGAIGGNVGNLETIGKGIDQNSKQIVFRLKLLDESVSEFVNETPIPGLMFSWGPDKSGAIAYTNREGRLTLMDQKKHKQAVAGVKDAVLPAWSADGSRLAWAQRSGRKKYTLVYADVSR